MICPVCNENISHYQTYEVINGNRVHLKCYEGKMNNVERNERND